MTQNQAKEALDELESLSRPLVEYLRKKHHPHTAIVVTNEQAVLAEEMTGVPFGAWDASEGGDKVNLKEIPTHDLVAELETREGVETNKIGPTASIEIKADGPAVVLLVID